MKKTKTITLFSLSFLLFVPTVYRLNISLGNGIIIVRGILADTITVLISIANIDIVNGVSLLLSLITIVLFVLLCCSNKHFTKLCFATLLSTGLSIIWKLILNLQLCTYMTVLGIIANVIPLIIYLGTLIFFVFYVIKNSPHRPTKAQRMQAQIDELQKQVDELKKED